jgi:hypothetical protein
MLIVENVTVGDECLRGVNDTDVKVDLARGPIRLIAQGCPAVFAKSTIHVRRRIINFSVSGKGDLLPVEADEGRNRGSGTAAAGVAVAVGDPQMITRGCEADAAAMALTGDRGAAHSLLLEPYRHAGESSIHFSHLAHIQFHDIISGVPYFAECIRKSPGHDQAIVEQKRVVAL